MGMPRGLAAVVLLAFAAVFPAFGQDEDGVIYAGAVQFPEGDRTFRRELSQATEAFKEGRYEDALEKLGPLVTADPLAARPGEPVLAEDYFLRTKDKAVITSLKTEALRLLDRIPAKAMRQFELQHGAEAEALLDQAIETGDAEKLAEVMRRFYHTEAGYRATLALGRLHLEQGRPQSAVGYLSRLVETPAAQRIIEPEASLLLAGALLHAGQPERAKDALLSLKQRVPTFAVRGVTSPSFSDEDEALPWLEKIFGRPRAGETATTLQWTMFRGNFERNATVAFAEPTSTPRWRIPIVNDPNDEKLVADMARMLEQQGIPSLPSIHPLVVQNTVLMRGPDRLVAIDIATGKRIWEPATEGSAGERNVRGGSPGQDKVIRSNQLKQRVWDDAPLGQLSSDGELVFFVGDLGDAAAYGSSPRNLIDPFNNRIRPNANVQKPTNKLFAVSLQKQGKLVWEAPSPGSDGPLSEAFFLGAPLPVNGQLFVIAELKGEIALVALEPRTGELKWKQQLAHVENSSVHTDSLRRVAGASPSFADGILVCPTTAGAVVAVEIASRKLLWGAPYTRGGEGIGGPRFSATLLGRGFSAYGKRWVDGAATISDGRVVLTPPDCAELLCLDLKTGKPAWPAQARGDLLFVAGVHEGTIVLVGKSQISGVKIADGSKAWEDIEIDTPSGRGLFDKQFYYQATGTGKLLVVDPTKGEIKQSLPTHKPLGNLVSYQDDILSLSDDCLAAYPRVDRLEQRIEKALLKNPEDPWALARRGELLMHARQWEEALKVLRQAHVQPSPDSAVQGLLVETILTMLEADFAKHERLLTEVEKLIEDPAASNRFHRVVATGREKSGDRLGAFQAFLAIDQQPVGHVDADPTGNEELIDLDRTWRAKSDRWIAAHLATLYAGAKPDERAAMDRSIAEKRDAIPRNAPAALRRFIERFSFHPLARGAQLDLAAVLARSNNLLEAESLVHRYVESADRQLAARANALAVEIYGLAGRWSNAAPNHERLASDLADVQVMPGKTGKQVADEAAGQFELRQALALLRRRYPRGRVVVETEPRSTVRNGPEQRRTYPLQLLQADRNGDAPLMVIHEPTQNTLRIRDSRGRDLTVVNLSRMDSRRFLSAGFYSARLSGNLLVVSTGHEVLGIDLLRSGRDPGEIIVWRQDLVDMNEQGVYTAVQTKSVANQWLQSLPRVIPADSIGRPIGIVSPITSTGLCFIKQRTLHCVDPLTGMTLWQRSDVEPGCDLFGDEEHLFVSPHDSDEARVYRMLDGSLVGTRKLATFEHRWATMGRMLLSWSLDGKSLKLEVNDVLTGENKWREAAPAGSRAWLCSPQEVALLTVEGHFKIRSLWSDAIKLEARLDKEPGLQNVFVLKSRDQYFVAVAIPPSNPNSERIIQAAPGGNHSQLFTGKVYAFDAKSGKPSWPAPAMVSQLSLPLDQPLDQPALLFMATVIPKTGPDLQRQLTSILCLDKRSGAVIFEDAKIPNGSQIYELQVQDDLSVRVAVPGKSVRLRFTEEPAPPEPPVQYGQSFAVRTGSGGVFGAIKRMFQPAEQTPIEFFGDP